jgi:hypothetical protein
LRVPDSSASRPVEHYRAVLVWPSRPGALPDGLNLRPRASQGRRDTRPICVGRVNNPGTRSGAGTDAADGPRYCGDQPRQ